jgi:hypothetical protein
MFKNTLIAEIAICSLLAACGGNADKPESGGNRHSEDVPATVPPDKQLVTYTEKRAICSDRSAERKALFGDLHVHTSYSLDAIAHGVRTLPKHAYQFAKGEAIPFFPLDENGEMTGSISIDRPLDFVAVTDHAELFGETMLCTTPGSAMYDHPLCIDFRAGGNESQLLLGSSTAMEEPERVSEICGADGSICIDAEAGPWRDIIAAAENAYDRSDACSFTSFVGYEFSSTPSFANNHHNVLFRNAVVPERPISFMDVKFDYELWRELDAVCLREDSCDYMTIPHNSNLSNGMMLAPYADLEKSRENRLEYARTRLNRETVAEIFQHKGASECMNGFASILGEPDELCDQEQVRRFGETKSIPFSSLQDGKLVIEVRELVGDDCQGQRGAGGILGGGCTDATDFFRTALLTGLKEEREIGLNPVKLGAIASTDTHFATPGATEEHNWQGHIGVERDRENRLKPGLLPSGIQGNPGGLAGVWSVENSRDAIFEALERREVFGTSGTRIKPRFFGGWSYSAEACSRSDMVSAGYADGVPMGGDLTSKPGSDAAPVFIAAASRDPAEWAAPLQKLQIVKGWVDVQGQLHYRIFDVAGDAETNAGIDVETGRRYGDGHATLCAVFQDPEFDARTEAYYYLRVVETPSPRWSLYDCLSWEPQERPAVCSDPDVPKIIQEMAWTSPIWYSPDR